MKYYFKAFKHYADFSGRARRKEYWLFVLFNLLVMLAAVFIDVANGWEPNLISVFDCGFFARLYYSIMFLPMLSLAVRRLHDTGNSGWWLFIGLIPVVGTLWLLTLQCTDSQKGTNRYGENPKIQPQPFTEYRRQKNLAVAFILTAVIMIFYWRIELYINHNVVMFNFFNFYTFIYTLPHIAMLIFGILIYPKSGAATKKFDPTALWILAAGLLLDFILVIVFIFQKQEFISRFNYNSIRIFMLLTLLTLIVSLLKKHRLITLTACVTVVIVVFTYILHAVFWLNTGSIGLPYWSILFITYLLFAVHCLPRQKINEPVFKMPTPVSAGSTKKAVNSADTDYPVYNGSGVCDVCNRSLTGIKAYIVPNSVFYNSPIWRSHFKNVQARMTGMQISDAYIEQMRATDRSAGSAVCENCIYMF